MMRIFRSFAVFVVRVATKGLSLTVALACVVFFVGYAVSEIGPEVVTVETFGPDGTRLTTRLWIVDEEGQPWLRAGLPSAEWLHRIEEKPRVVLHRVTGVREFDAVPVREPEALERVQALMRAKYGLRDLLVSLIHDDRGSVAIRLDPISTAVGEGRATLEEAPQPDPTPTAARWRARAPEAGDPDPR